MKVKFGAEQKRFITVDQLPEVKKIINEMKSDAFLNDYAATAARLAMDENGVEILKAEAEIAKNCRVFNRYSEFSGDLDVWINIYAFNFYKGFYVIGVYLSDIWDIGDDNREYIKKQMYIVEYKR